MEQSVQFFSWTFLPPEEVLKECAAEMMDYNGHRPVRHGNEAHRSSAYKPIIEDAEARVRKLMNVPANYKILFPPGPGGSTRSSPWFRLNLAITRPKPGPHQRTGPLRPAEPQKRTTQQAANAKEHVFGLYQSPW